MKSLLMKPPASPRQGVALVLTLLVIAMLVVVVVGFTAVGRLEQVAARNFTYQAAAQQLAQLATDQAINQLREAVASGVQAGIYATQPGLLHPLGQDPIPLFSQGGGGFNINALTENGFVTGSPQQSISVGLQNVLDDSGRALGQVAFYIDDESVKIPVNYAGPSRTSLNPVSPRPFSIAAVDTNLPMAASDQFGSILASRSAQTNIGNWSYFFTPDQLASAVPGIGPVRSRRTTVATETNVGFAQQTPWGTPKIQINQLPVTDESLATLLSAMTNAALSNVFGGHFGDKYGEAALRQLAANMLQLRSAYWSADYLSTTNDEFGTVLEDVDILGLQDLPAVGPAVPAANSGSLKKTNALPQNFMGYIPFPMLAEVAVGGLEYGFTIGAGESPVAPDDNMAIRFFVACKLINPFPVQYPGGGEIFVQMDKARVRMTNANPSTFSPNVNDQVWRGPDGSHRQLAPGYNDMPGAGGASPWDPWGHGDGVSQERPEPRIPPIPPDGEANFPPPGRTLVPASGIATSAIPPINAGATTNVFIPFTIITSARHPTTGLYTGAGAEMYVIVDQVRISAESGRADSVRDWCSGPDMRAALGQEDTAQFILPVAGVARQGSFEDGNYQPSPQPVSLDPSRWVAIAKADPRLKAGFESAEENGPWRTATATLDRAELAFGPNNFLDETIPSDPAFGQNPIRALFNTNLPPLLPLASGNYGISADLGKVFTGVPWRTLRMQPQPASEVEAGLVPDWVLMDMIEFSPLQQPITAVNPNIAYASAGAPAASFGSGLRSQLLALTNVEALRVVADPNDPRSLVQQTVGDAQLLRMSATDLASLFQNLANLAEPGSWAGAGNNTWRERRQQIEFPEDVLLLPSELAEVRTIANFIASANVDLFKLNEYRLASLYPGVSTRSRFFKIYAVGRAVTPANPNGVAATALLQTLVEVDSSASPPTIRTIYQYPAAD